MLLAGGACVHQGRDVTHLQPPAALPTAESTPAVAQGLLPQVEALLQKMTLEQKVGQLMMVGFDGLTVDAAVSELVRRRHVGGVCLFKRNIATAEQVAALTDDMRRLFDGAVPPFLAVDQEGGNVVRLSDRNLVLPGNMVLGATRDLALAYEAGRAQGEDLRRLGFNMNLAPVLDVNSNPRNPVIGVRAFGDDVALVSALGSQFVRGQQAARIVTVAKHFPGHGAVDADSHKGLPVVTVPVEVLRQQLLPFMAAMQVGLDGMMTAHIATPTLSGGDETPATLSRRVLGEVLRDELKFDGLVVTDELEMDAIDRRYGVGPAAVLAVLAGADMVLVPWRVEKETEVYDALLAAARAGTVPLERLDQSVRRVLTVKWRRGVFEPLSPRAERLAGLGRDADVATRIASAGVTLLKTDRRYFPLPARGVIGVVSAAPALLTALKGRASAAQTLLVPTWPRLTERAALTRRVREVAEGCDVVVVGVTNARHLDLVTAAQKTGKPVVVVVLGAPYLASLVPAAAAVLSVYSSQPSVAEAAARALLGQRGPTGRLPVALPHLPFGFGLDGAGQPLPDVVQAGLSSPARASADE